MTIYRSATQLIFWSRSDPLTPVERWSFYIFSPWSIWCFRHPYDALSSFGDGFLHKMFFCSWGREIAVRIFYSVCEAFMIWKCLYFSIRSDSILCFPQHSNAVYFLYENRLFLRDCRYTLSSHHQTSRLMYSRIWNSLWVKVFRHPLRYYYEYNKLFKVSAEFLAFHIIHNTHWDG